MWKIDCKGRIKKETPKQIKDRNQNKILAEDFPLKTEKQVKVALPKAKRRGDTVNDI